LFAGIGNTGVTWDFGNGEIIKNINPIKYAYETPGTYVVNVKADYRVCPDTNISRVINVMPQPAINIGNDTAICKGGVPIILKDKLNANNPKARWEWSTGAKTPSISVTTPGEYSVTVRIDGCYTQTTLKVVEDCYMNVPNVFSPNGDGINDYFNPRYLLSNGLTSFKMEIYNRWGQLIFETSSLEGRGWDGKFNDVQQPQGVFVYVIDATFKDGQKEHHQGNVTLLR
jgi:gliding motility-associated-like protein